MVHAGRSWASILGALMLIALVTVEAEGLGERQTAVRDVRGFESVSFGTSGQLIITQGDQESLEIEARAVDLPGIVSEVRDGTLFVDWASGGPAFSLRPPVFRLTVKTITGLETHSSGRIAVGDLRSGSLVIRVHSSGGISIGSLAADALSVQITSSGSIAMAGTVRQQDVLLSSSGNYLARDLASTTARIRVSSSGSAILRVSDSLEAIVTSSGNVRYYGTPSRLDRKVTSSGRLVNLGE